MKKSKSQDVMRIGMLVQVKEGYRNPHLRRRIGTVRQRYGDLSYAAFEVEFGKGAVEAVLAS